MIESLRPADGIMELRLNRPQKRNALTLQMYERLVEQLESAAQDASVNVVMLSGAGESFCAGNDIADFLALGLDSERLGVIVQFLHALVDFPKPLLAGVQGDAVGIGTTMLLHCDLVLAADTLRCQMPFVKLGLVPEGGSSLLLPQVLGQRQAFELLIEGQAFGAERALQLGLVNAQLTSQRLSAELLARAQAIAALPAEAVRLSKALLKREQRARLHDCIDAEARLFAERLGSAEARQAFAAFLHGKG